MRVRVLERSYLNHRVVEPGEEIDFDPGLDGEGKPQPLPPHLKKVTGKAKAEAEGETDTAA
jgi:hypothetical protein